MNISKLMIVYLTSLWIDYCVCKFYTSSFGISKFLDIEKNILNSLNVFFERQQKKGITIDADVREFVTYGLKQTNQTTEKLRVTENPLSVFYVISRAVDKWSELAKNLSCNEEIEKCPILTGADVINVDKRRHKSEWPTELELKESARAIVNVWNMYDLDIAQITNGTLDQVSERHLSADEIFFIANAARDNGMTYEAVTWFEYLLQRLESFPSHAFKTSSLYKRLASSYQEYGMQSEAIQLLQNYSQIDDGDKGVVRDLEYMQKFAADDKVTELVRFADNDTTKHTRDIQHFEKLCRSSAQGKTNSSRTLRCSLIPLYNCYGTVKVELLSKRPRIEILYDVLSFKETDNIISYGEHSFIQFREMFPFKAGSSIATDDTRIKSGPMCEWDAQYPLMRKLTTRLERMTRFQMYPVRDVTSSECYTMTNEAPGLITKPMVDAWPLIYQPYPFAGNRLATIMLQLSDVKYGGSVVFPRLNLTVPVNRGSAVIWSNLKLDGKPSARSIHTSCPVMIGSHWALYKHILYSNQLFRRPCEA